MQELIENAKPILFNTEMVRAILDGRKTQTRRVVQSEYQNVIPNNAKAIELLLFAEKVSPVYLDDILYVRETWAVNPDFEDEIIYRADDIENNWKTEYQNFNWKPSIHMPKEYARIFLKVTNVRVERLQDITLKDILREGVQGTRKTIEEVKKEKCQVNTLIPNWIELWNSTAKQGYKWEDNPYVFVYEFERIRNVS